MNRFRAFLFLCCFLGGLDAYAAQKVLVLPVVPLEKDQIAPAVGTEMTSAIVDELLASPHFGERLASYWLDLVRYADTVGYHGDHDHAPEPTSGN